MFTSIIYKPEILINIFSPALDLRKGKMSPNNVQTLMKIFRINAYPRIEEIYQLAMSLNVTKRKVHNWFCYMRHKTAEEGLLDKGE